MYAKSSSGNHRFVGTLDLACDAVELPAGTGLTLTAYPAEAGIRRRVEAGVQLGSHQYAEQHR